MPIKRMDPAELTSSVALLVVDAQDAFIDSLAQRDSFLERCAFAIDAARTLDILTIFTEQVPAKLGSTHSALLKRASNPKVFSKVCFSALGAPGMEDYLRNNEIYHLLVCGLETPICIYQTGLQAVDEDIDVTFLADALGCRRTQDAEFALHALRGMGCQTLPCESVFYSLLSDANHPRFKAFSDLVKAFSSPGFSLKKHLETPLPFDQTEKEKTAPQQTKRRKGRTQKSTNSRRPQSSSSNAKKSGKKQPSEPPKSKGQPEQRSTAKKNANRNSKRQNPDSSPKKQARKTPRKRVARKSAKASSSKPSRNGDQQRKGGESDSSS